MVNLQSSLKVSCRYLIPVTQGEPEFNADALYAFKSRGFGGEIGVVRYPNKLAYQSTKFSADG